jgi:hypothetical protein
MIYSENLDYVFLFLDLMYFEYVYNFINFNHLKVNEALKIIEIKTI